MKKKKLTDSRAYLVSMRIEITDDRMKRHGAVCMSDECYINQELGWSFSSFAKVDQVHARRIR